MMVRTRQNEIELELEMSGDDDKNDRDRQGLAGPDGLEDSSDINGSGGNARVVNSEATLNEWTRQVWLDTKLSQWARGILTSLSGDLDRSKWTAPLIRAKMIDDEEGYGFNTRTYDKYRKEAIKSGWVEKVGETMIKYGERSQWYPEYRLTFKG